MLMGGEERGGLCLAETVGVELLEWEDPGVGPGQRGLGRTRSLPPDICRAVLQQKGKTRSQKPEPGLVEKQSRSEEELLRVKLPSPGSTGQQPRRRGHASGCQSPGPC